MLLFSYLCNWIHRQRILVCNGNCMILWCYYKKHPCHRGWFVHFHIRWRLWKDWLCPINYGVSTSSHHNKARKQRAVTWNAQKCLLLLRPFFPVCGKVKCPIVVVESSFSDYVSYLWVIKKHTYQLSFWLFTANHWSPLVWKCIIIIIFITIIIIII